MSQSIEEKVKKVIAEELSVDPSRVTPNATFAGDLGADSLDTVELVMSLEEHFGMDIPDEEAQKLLTVQDVIDFINHKTKA